MSDVQDAYYPDYNPGFIVDEIEYDFGMGQNMDPSQITMDMPESFLELLEPARYKIYYGGRGSGKSWQIARALVIIAVTQAKRILCCREYQSSIAESVHYILVDQIRRLGLLPWFHITDKTIYCPTTGSEFIFKGLRLHINEIKSTEAVDICWVEEGQALSKASWNTLDPTIRSPGSEIWVSYNPLNEVDIIHHTFVMNQLPEFRKDGTRYALVREVNYTENPWFPPDLEEMRQRMLNEDQDIYAHVWLGKTLQISDAVIFKDKWEVREFEAPEGARFFFGADWGFSNDPTVLVRCYIEDDCLWVDHEVYARKVDLSETSALFAGDDGNGGRRWKNTTGYPGIPGAQQWPIKGDNSRPESISYLAREGLRITAAEKWKGSVEDGIAHLRAFRKIIIHTRCTNLQEEALMYRYKVDPKTDLVLPVIVDAHNHGWDALRYALDGYIQRRGSMGMWARLGGV